MKGKTKRFMLTLTCICLAILQCKSAFATADSLELVCPDKVEEKIISCKLSGYSNAPINSITASFSKIQNAKYNSSKSKDGSNFTIKANNNSIVISSTETFKGAFEIGTVDFVVSSTEKNNTTTTSVTIELDNVLFATGETESSTAIGSTTSTIAPYVADTNPTTNNTNTTNTTNTTTNVANNTNGSLYTKKDKNIPVILLVIGVGIIVIVGVVVVFVMKKKKTQTARPDPIPQAPQVPQVPINQIINPAPVAPQPPVAPAQPVLPQAPRPTMQPQTPQPQVVQPTGISVKNLPFEKASSDNPMSFES